jgi:hypothetical protein
MDFYARRTALSPVLGLEEGETRKVCPPGTVKSYLPHFPWSECIPEEEALQPHLFPSKVARPGPTATTTSPSGGPPPAPAPLPPPPPVPAAPAPLPPVERKARFLAVDHQSGDILDPSTGAVIESATAYSIDTVDTVAIGAGIGIVAVLLALAGVFD